MLREGVYIFGVRSHINFSNQKDITRINLFSSLRYIYSPQVAVVLHRF
jgi:hypothetical protein